MAKKSTSTGTPALSIDRKTGKFKSGDDTMSLPINTHGITPGHVQQWLDVLDGSLPMPKSAREAEFVLWLSGMRPQHCPTRGEQFLAAMIKSKQSQRLANAATTASHSPPKDKSKKRSTDKPAASWTPEVETEGRRILEANEDMSSNEFVRLVGGNRTVAQSLYRFITGKEKRTTRTD